MDWIIPTIMAAVGLIGGLGGAWIMGRFTLRAQQATQRAENTRHARKIAYEAAVTEWERMREFVFREIEQRAKNNVAGGEVNTKIPMPILEDYIIHHLAFADFQTRIKYDSGFDEIEKYIRLSIQRANRFFAFRLQVQNETEEFRY